MANLAGSWKLANSDNWAAFLDAMDVPAPAKAKLLAAEGQATVDISKDGDAFNFKISGPEKTMEQRVPVGPVFDLVNSVTGQTKKGVASMEGSKLVVKPGADYPKEPTSSYEVADGKLVCTMTVAGVTTTRVFSRA